MNLQALRLAMPDVMNERIEPRQARPVMLVEIATGIEGGTGRKTVSFAVF
ncbi:hypothetical protein [Ensifer canadensis]